MTVSRKVGRRSRSSVSRRKHGHGKYGKHGQYGRRYKHAHTHNHRRRFHKSGFVGINSNQALGPVLHRPNGGVVEAFVMSSAYLGEYELTYSTTKWFSKNVTNKFHAYYQMLDHNKLYLIRIKDEKFKEFLCLDTRENTIKDLDNFDSGTFSETPYYSKLEFKLLDIETGNDTGIRDTFDNSNQNNIDNFGKILAELVMPQIPLTAQQ